MTKISKTKHITKRGVVKKNPQKMIKLGNKIVTESSLRAYAHTIAGFHDKVRSFRYQGMNDKQAVRKAEDEIIEKIKVCYS